MHPLQWLGSRDRGFSALRRAGRTALVMPATFALSETVIGNPAIATFAAFGSFAMLLLVDFRGPMRVRLAAQAALALAGGFFVCVGTVASRATWLAAAAMALVAFGVLFVGVISSVLAGASTSLLLAFILPVSLAGPISSIPDRLAGWGIASGAALLAVALLWPTPSRNPLRGSSIEACRAIAARLRSEVATLVDRESAPSGAEHDEVIARAAASVAALQQAFFATPYQPTGLSTAARTIVRLVDEVGWLHAIVVQSAGHRGGFPASRAACAVKGAAASVLEYGASLLDEPGSGPDGLHAGLEELRRALGEMEESVTAGLPFERPPPGDRSGLEEWVGDLLTSLDPSFRAQELSFAISHIAANIDLTAAAERRSSLQRMLGRQPLGVSGSLSAARERATAHVERHSVWLHNSLRGAAGLGLAVLVARLTGVQHAFWVVLGTLSVLRSNALNTGQNAIRAVLGTAVGFIVGAALLALIGTNAVLLWLLLPLTILVAGLAPTAVSFAAGQAGFTLTLVIVFNIIQPAGWRVGLLRVEDIALGAGVSLVVGLLLWPRGAAAALGKALAEAYADSARYLAAAVAFGIGRCDQAAPALPAPKGEETRAAAALGRLDDAFRGFLAERGAKPIPLAEVASLLSGASGLRIGADAVLELWERDEGRAGGERAAARRELSSGAELVVGWYQALAASLEGRREVPEPLTPDELAAGRLVDAMLHDLRGVDGHTSATAIRMIWTNDHLDAVRRLQGSLVGPARAAVQQDALRSSRFPWRALIPRRPLGSDREPTPADARARTPV